MKKIDRHIALPFDLHNKLKTLSKENEITYTSLVEELIRKGIDEIDILKKIKEIESELIYIKNNNPKLKYQKKYEIINAIKSINKELEKAEEDFSKLFEKDKEKEFIM